MFVSLIIHLFQFVFSAGTIFSLITNQPEEYFDLFFQRSERDDNGKKLNIPGNGREGNRPNTEWKFL